MSSGIFITTAGTQPEITTEPFGYKKLIATYICTPLLKTISTIFTISVLPLLTQEFLEFITAQQVQPVQAKYRRRRIQPA